MRRPDVFSILASIVTLILLILIILSFTPTTIDGTAKVGPNGPTAISIGPVTDGQKVMVDYDCSRSVSVFLMDEDDLKRASVQSFGNNIQLPDPVLTDDRGSFTLRMNGSGRRYIAFWNESFSKVHTVDYRIDKGPRYKDRGYIVSMIGMSVLDLVLLSIAVIRIRSRVKERGDTCQ